MAFDEKDFEAAMKSTGKYSAACNLWWMDLSWRPCRHVFTNCKAVEEMATFHFSKGPAEFPWTIVVAVPDRNMSASDVIGHGSSLKRISPEEQEASLLFAVANRIRAGANEKELQQWRKVMLTVTMQFEVHADGDSAYFRSVNIRRAVIVQNEALVRSALQQIQEILEFKARKEASMGKTIDSSTLRKMWNEHVVQISSQYTDEISVTWIECGVRVHKKILQEKDLRQVVVWLDACK